jgi:PAS domain S-box-containing protein
VTAESRADRVIGEAIAIDPLLDNAPCGFASLGDDGTIHVVNTTLLGMLGYDREELLGRHFETILTVGAKIFFQTHFFPLLRMHGRADEIFFLLRAKNGDDIAAIVNAIRRERGGRWISDCVMIHVRERQKFEDALLRAKKAAEEARTAEEVQRRLLEEANDVLERQALELELGQQQLMEQAEELEQQSDELRALNEHLMEQAEELERQRAVANEANRAKSAFLAMMSHELRTPLNAIGGYVQLLEMGIQGPVSDAQTESLGRIARSQRHLLRLINDVLNLARIEAGRVDYNLETLRLRDVVDSVLPMVEPQLATRRLRYGVTVDSDLSVVADREKVQQILLNLLSNAIKFTPAAGEVTIDGFTDPTKPDAVHLRVRDTGIGIPADRITHVFEPFVQVDDSHARRAEGTGLGLAISRDLARGMGGELRARSTEGRGSSFTLTLPAQLGSDS